MLSGMRRRMGLDNRFPGLTARVLVTMHFLDPLEIDRGNDADEQVGMAADVHFIGLHRAMQAFVKQNVARGGEVLPRREHAGLQSMGASVLLVVQVAAHLPAPTLAVFAKQRLQFFEEIGFRTEMTEIGVALALLLDHLLLHALPVVAVEGVALNDRRDHAFAPEDLLESRPHGAVPAPEEPVITMMGCLTDKEPKPLRKVRVCVLGLYPVSVLQEGRAGSACAGSRYPSKRFLNPPSRLKSLLAKATFCAHWACRLRLSCGRRCRHYRAPLGSRELARSLNRDHVGRACLQSKR